MGSMKKLMFILFAMFAFAANAQNTKATLNITQVADAEFTTDIFQLIFYGDVKLSTADADYAKMIGEGYDVQFTFFESGLYEKAHLMRYSYVGAACIATLQSPLFGEKIVVNCIITEVTNIDALIVISVRGLSKVTNNKHK